jgi:hypothetical protein
MDFCTLHGMGFFLWLFWTGFSLSLFSWLWAYPEYGLLVSCWMGSFLLFS